jgi:hypothetical protein
MDEDDAFKARRELRAAYGVICPDCSFFRPRAVPHILLPGQRCPADGYLDPRPSLTNKQQSNV